MFEFLAFVLPMVAVMLFPVWLPILALTISSIADAIQAASAPTTRGSIAEAGGQASESHAGPQRPSQQETTLAA